MITGGIDLSSVLSGWGLTRSIFPRLSPQPEWMGMPKKKSDFERLVRDVCIVLVLGLGALWMVSELVKWVASSPIQHW